MIFLSRSAIRACRSKQDSVILPTASLHHTSRQQLRYKIQAAVALRIRVSRHKEDTEMSLLPMSTPPRATSPANGFARGSKSAMSKLKVLARRGINFKQMVRCKLTLTIISCLTHCNSGLRACCLADYLPVLLSAASVSIVQSYKHHEPYTNSFFS